MYTLQEKKKNLALKYTDKINSVSASSNPPVYQKISPFGSYSDTQQEKKISSNQTGIPDSIKREFERKIDSSLDEVRVHYQSSKPEQFDADAYTQGSQVYIAPGKEKYLRHELGHVLQQKMGMVSPTHSMQGVSINRDTALEKNADWIANGSGRLPIWNVPYFSMGNAPIQMHPKDVSLKEEAEQDVFPIVAQIKVLAVRKALLSQEMQAKQEALDEETDTAKQTSLSGEIAAIELKLEALEAEIQGLSELPTLQAGFYKEVREKFPASTRASTTIANMTTEFGTITLQQVQTARQTALTAGIQEAEVAALAVTSVSVSDLVQNMHDVETEDLSKWDRSILGSGLTREQKRRKRVEIHRKYRSDPGTGPALSSAELEHGAYLQMEQDTNAYLSTLSVEEKRALIAYVGGSYQDHNKYLRNALLKQGKGKLDKMSSFLTAFPNKTDGFNRLYRAILDYQSIFHGTGHASSQQAPPALAQPITVYRGKGFSLLSASNPGKNLLELPSDKEKTPANYFLKAQSLLAENDTIFVESGVMSTSKNPYLACQFSTGILLIIKVPQGMRALAITGRVETGGISDTMTKFEEEITFPPRRVMRMLAVEQAGDLIKVYCQMLP